MAYPTEVPRSSSRTRSCLKSIVIAFVLLFLLCYLVLVPAVEMVIRSIGSILTSFALGFQQVLTACYDTTCEEVSQNLKVGILLGHPIECAAIEEVEWNTVDEARVDLKFEVKGPFGVGQAHALVGLHEDGAAIESLSVVTAEGVAIIRP